MTTRVSRAESQQQTRRKLLAAAANRFIVQGYWGASVDDILAEASLSKGAMYANFASKEALFLALLDQTLDAQMQAIREIMARPDPLAVRIAAIGNWAPQFVENPAGWRLLATEFWLHAVRTPPVQPQLAQRYADQRREVATIIEEGYQSIGQQPPLPSLELAAAVIGMINGLSVLQVIDPAAVPNHVFSKALGQLLGLSLSSEFDQ